MIISRCGLQAGHAVLAYLAARSRMGRYMPPAEARGRAWLGQSRSSHRAPSSGPPSSPTLQSTHAVLSHCQHAHREHESGRSRHHPRRVLHSERHCIYTPKSGVVFHPLALARHGRLTAPDRMDRYVLPQVSLESRTMTGDQGRRHLPPSLDSHDACSARNVPTRPTKSPGLAPSFTARSVPVFQKAARSCLFLGTTIPGDADWSVARGLARALSPWGAFQPATSRPVRHRCPCSVSHALRCRYLLSLTCVPYRKPCQAGAEHLHTLPAGRRMRFDNSPAMAYRNRVWQMREERIRCRRWSIYRAGMSKRAVKNNTYTGRTLVVRAEPPDLTPAKGFCEVVYQYFVQRLWTTKILDCVSQGACPKEEENR